MNDAACFDASVAAASPIAPPRCGGTLTPDALDYKSAKWVDRFEVVGSLPALGDGELAAQTQTAAETSAFSGRSRGR